jgi:serine phosphatase RsbU (regulator of sigma subunit)
MTHAIKNAFVIHQPMSGVGGDGYWVHNTGTTTFLVVFDCMGHGRLASMMTRIYLNSIKNSIIDNQLTDPGEILMDIHKQIEEQFKDKEKRLVGCGADLGIIRIDVEKEHIIQYGGAKMDLVKVEKGELERFRGNKRQLGETFEAKRNYQTEEYTISSEHRTRFYLYSDGVTDFFGGPDDKKFSFKNLKPLLEEVDELPLDKAKKAIQKRLDDWRGHYPPTDDTVMICIEV